MVRCSVIRVVFISQVTFVARFIGGNATLWHVFIIAMGLQNALLTILAVIRRRPLPGLKERACNAASHYCINPTVAAVRIYSSYLQTPAKQVKKTLQDEQSDQEQHYSSGALANSFFIHFWFGSHDTRALELLYCYHF